MEERQTEIDGETFRLTILRYKDARRVFMLLSRTVGPALAQAMDQAESLETFQKSQGFGGLAKAAERLIRDMTESDLEELFEVFGRSCVVVRGDKALPMNDTNQNRVFSGRLMLSFKWLWWCIEENFSDFFDALKPQGDAPG